MEIGDKCHKVALVAGTRPEIIKLFPIMKLFDEQKIPYTFIFTGQHYSFNLFMNFIKEFKVRSPDFFIDLNYPDDAVSQFSMLITEIGKILKLSQPSSVIIAGDTNSVIATALTASKLRIPIIHIEAGLRSYDWRMQEEYNRRVTDHISDLLFAPTKEAVLVLEKEKVQGQIYLVGNTVIDAIRICLESDMEKYDNNKHDKLSKYEEIVKGTENYVLLTLHREENVNNAHNLKTVLEVLSEFDFNCIFPVHPHTMQKLKEFDLGKSMGKNLKIIDPVGYIDFVNLMKNCQFVITDSGGIQEEITAPQINKKALVLRNSTERYESLLSGHAVLCNVEYVAMKNAINNILNSLPVLQSKPTDCPYGNGYSAEKIIEVLKKGELIPLQERVMPRRMDQIGQRSHS
jgi:UDP-N-acetylglucosamine 2-epimerase (non-hydrolysing)